MPRAFRSEISHANERNAQNKKKKHPTNQLLKGIQCSHEDGETVAQNVLFSYDCAFYSNQAASGKLKILFKQKRSPTNTYKAHELMGKAIREDYIQYISKALKASLLCWIPLWMWYGQRSRAKCHYPMMIFSITAWAQLWLLLSNSSRNSRKGTSWIWFIIQNSSASVPEWPLILFGKPTTIWFVFGL